MAQLVVEGSNGHHYFELNVFETSYDISSNSSEVYYSLNLDEYSGGWNWDWSGSPDRIQAHVTIDDEDFYSNIPVFDCEKITIISGYKTIHHNSDGTKNIDFSFEVNDTTGQYYTCGDASGSSDIDLTTIPRSASCESFSKPSDLSGTFSVSCATQTDSYYYNLRISIPNIIKIKDIELGNRGAYSFSATFSFNKSERENIYNRYNNQNSVTIGVVVETYSDSGYSNKIGESDELTQVVSFVSSEVQPDISCVISDPTNFKDTVGGGKFIQNISKVMITPSAKMKYGATFSNARVSLDGMTYTSSSLSSITSNVIKFLSLNSISDNLPLTLTITDSRNISSTYSTNIEVYRYIYPYVDIFEAVRCDDNGTPNEEGYNIRLNISSYIYKLNDNTHTFTVKIKKASDSTYNSIDELTDLPGVYDTSTGTYKFENNAIIKGASTEYSYDIILILNDTIKGESSRHIRLGVGYSLIDIHPSAKGIAFGKVSEYEAFECAMPSRFTKDVLITNNLNVGGTSIVQDLIGDTAKFTDIKIDDGLEIPVLYDKLNQRATTTSSDKEAFQRSWTINGTGLFILNAAVWTDTTSDYGTTACAIYVNSACVTANTHRYGESSNAVELDAGATFVYWFQNVENVSVLLKAGSTKTGTKTLTYTSQGLFGLTVLEAA